MGTLETACISALEPLDLGGIHYLGSRGKERQILSLWERGRCLVQHPQLRVWVRSSLLRRR